MTATVATPATLFKRTGGDDFPDHIKAMISGPPKSGKTTLLGTVPNIVIADTEPHANNLQSVAHKNLPFVTVNSTQDLQRLLFVLRDDTLRAKAAEQLGIPKIEAVSIDTLDTLQKIMKGERMREQRTSKFLRDDWGWLKEELTAIILAFTKLPMHVFFVVHIKTKDIGTEENPQTIILPGLEGGLSEEVAGMVGYSLLSFRKEELRQDGSKFTKYWLRAEGDDTYQYLGNRAAGRLPSVIEPNFHSIYEAAMAGRKAIQAPVQPAPLELPSGESMQINQTNGAAPTPGVTPAVAPQPAPAQPAAEKPAQNLGSSAPVAEPAATPPAEPVAAAPQPQPASTAATVDGQPAATKPGDDEPVNAAALTYAQKVYEAAGLEYPDAVIRGLTVGQARSLVRMWQAIQQDAVEGKLEQAPADEMARYLNEMDWLSDADKARVDSGAAAPEPVAAPTGPAPDITGTIEQVVAYIGDDLAKAQEAYDLEIAKPRPRATLINALVSKGVQVQTPVQNPPEAPVAAPVAAAPPVEPAPPWAPAATAAPPVTPQAPPVDSQGTGDSQEQNAMALLQDQLGAVPIGADGKPLPCEECGGEVDDEDIATLSKSRFDRRLCVADYIAETKKPRG